MKFVHSCLIIELMHEGKTHLVSVTFTAAGCGQRKGDYTIFPEI